MAAQPLHESISSQIRERIVTGVWKEGEIIPSEVELSEEFGVSRPTIRHALEPLVAEGLLDRRRKRGTMVRPAKLRQSYASSLAPLEDAARAAGREPSCEVLFSRHVEADDALARELGVEKGSDVLRVALLHKADGQPVAVEETFVSAALAGGLEGVDLAAVPLGDALAGQGVKVASATRRFEVVPAHAQAAVLGVAEGAPLVMVRGELRDAAGAPVAAQVAYFRGDANAFEVEVRA